MASISNDLYYLIERMSRTEKAYFKKFGFKYQKEENKSEFILFDVINTYLKKEAVDDAFEKLIVNRFSKKVKGKHFISLKNSLFQSIVKTLISYDTATDIPNQTLMQCMEAKSLLKRNMTKSALKIINKGREVNRKQENHNIQLLLSEVEMNIGIVSNDKEIIKTAQEHEHENLELIQANYEIRILYEEIYNIHRTHGVDEDGSLRTILEPFVEQYKTIFSKGSPSLKFQFNYYSTGKLIGYILMDKNEIIKNLLGIVRLIETEGAFFKGKNNFILATYSDLICHGLEMGETRYYEEYLQNFLDLEVNSVQLEGYKKSLHFKIKSTYALLNEDYAAFVKLESEFEIVKEDLSFNNLMAVYEDFIFAFFMSKKYKKAIQFIYAQLDICKKKQERLDFMLSSELMLLAINYELGDFDVIQSLVRSFNNRMVKSEGFGENEKTILGFFKNIQKNNFGDRKELALSTRNSLMANNYKSSDLRFNFVNWFLEVSKMS